MKMIPAVPYCTPSNAEIKVFSKLEAALPKSGLTAYHSLNLPHHPYKRFGEIDFLLFGPQGLFVLEVKGGLVTCDAERLWHFTDRYGRDATKRESPFAQAESALHGFRSILERNFDPSGINRFVIGYGVVLPDCDIQPGAEWDRNTYANLVDMQDFDHWLETFIGHWRKKHVKTQAWSPPDPALVEEVKAFIRPRFEAVVPLHIQASRAEEQICRLTEGQMKLLDHVIDNPRLLCSGGAGTGKTFMAMELARRWARGGNPVLLACHSPWLKCYLESRFDIPHLTVSTASSLAVNAKRAGIHRYAALIVDEGQDLFNREDLETLESFLEGGFDSGTWCMFYDVNNQSNLFGGMDEDALVFLEQANSFKFRLTTNVRNTKMILEKIKDRLGADMGIESVGPGPEVREYQASSEKEAVSMLVREIDRVITRGGLIANQLTILSPRPWPRSTASLLPASLTSSLAALDEYSVRRFPPSKMSYGEIAAFKGLENEAIIVVDLPEPRFGASERVLHYVGMSRARAVLTMIYRSYEG